MASLIDHLRVHAFRIPTEEPESDGTADWDSTTLLLVEAASGGVTGMGYSYTHAAAARLVDEHLKPVVVNADAMQIQQAWLRMQRISRNVGAQAICAAGISAVDNALWDLKARLLDVALVDLLSASRTRTPVYGSGGFTSYADERLQRQFAEWVEHGITMVKMKVGRRPELDVRRVEVARKTIGEHVDLFVDANGALSPKQALWFAESFADYGVNWFEEPVTSDDLDGLRLVRERGPAGMDVAAGEYGWDQFYFQRMLDAGAVDVLQADATRCGGITGFLAAGALCQARSIDLSAHTAPNLHAHAGCGVARIRHIEYFHDHARIEELLFEGALEPSNGALEPDRSRPGFGLAFRWQDAEPYRVYGAAPSKGRVGRTEVAVR